MYVLLFSNKKDCRYKTILSLIFNACALHDLHMEVYRRSSVGTQHFFVGTAEQAITSIDLDLHILKARIVHAL